MNSDRALRRGAAAMVPRSNHPHTLTVHHPAEFEAIMNHK